MKEFLKKYMSEDELKKLEEDYKKANPDAQGLPVYVGKKRLDEVLEKEKTAKAEVDRLTKELETTKTGNQAAIDAAVKKAVDEANAVSTKALEDQKKSYETDAAILKAKGKNLTAIKALIDPSKKLEDEIARLQKDESYLFELPGDDDDVPPGTGKKKSDPAGEKQAELNKMRRAVGLIR